MRIWDIPVSRLSRRHLLAEHRELHAIWVYLTTDKGGSYRKHPETLRWAGQLRRLRQRHEEQVGEMDRRGWRHRSPLPESPPARGTRRRLALVNTVEEQIELLRAKGCECDV